MNWYKRSQRLEVLDSRDIQGKGRSYTDTGHDIYYEEQNKTLGKENVDYSVDEPNIMWIYNNGEIETKIETADQICHRAEEAWGLESGLDNLYTGRFSPSEKVISVIPPYVGVSRFRGIPRYLQYLLRITFPSAEKIIQY